MIVTTEEEIVVEEETVTVRGEGEGETMMIAEIGVGTVGGIVVTETEANVVAVVASTEAIRPLRTIGLCWGKDFLLT